MIVVRIQNKQKKRNQNNKDLQLTVSRDFNENAIRDYIVLSLQL